MGSVSLMSGDVMELEIVWMDLMKWIALVGILPVFSNFSTFIQTNYLTATPKAQFDSYLQFSMLGFIVELQKMDCHISICVPANVCQDKRESGQNEKKMKCSSSFLCSSSLSSRL